MRKTIYLTLLVLAFIFISNSNSASAKMYPCDEEYVIEDFDVVDLEGNSTSILSGKYEDKVRILVFGRVGCLSSNHTLKYIGILSDKLTDKVQPIFIDSDGDFEKMYKYKRDNSKTNLDYASNGFVYNNYMWNLKWKLCKEESLSVCLPMTVIVDSSDRIRFYSEGMLTTTDLLEALYLIDEPDIFTDDNKDYRAEILEHNKSKHAEGKASKKTQKKYLREAKNISKKNNDIATLAKEITLNATTEYEKAKAIHDWIVNNIYFYDNEKTITKKGETVYMPPVITDFSATTVLKDRKTTCNGYTNLTAALCRAVNIPCKVVIGYTLTDDIFRMSDNDNIDVMDVNHTWNEIYVDDRWIIVDTFCDCYNIFFFDEEILEDKRDLYFDISLEDFSCTHKISKYQIKGAQ